MVDDLTFRRRHIGRALARVFWLFEAQVLAMVRAEGFDEVTQADLNVVRVLPVAGGRQTELAERAGITKQGMGKLVAGLEERGLLQTVPDPADGRAKIVEYTPRGLELLAAAGRIIARLEAEWADQIGAERLDEARTVLFELADAFGPSDYL